MSTSQTPATSALERLLRPRPCPYSTPPGRAGGSCDYAGPLIMYAGAPSECPKCGRRVVLYATGNGMGLQTW